MSEVKELTVDQLAEELSPTDYFVRVKGKKKNITEKELRDIYQNCIELMEKCFVTGQKEAIKKLYFHMEAIEKEMEVIRAGIDQYVLKDDVEEFIDKVSSKVVKIIELESYERAIPDDIIEKMKQVKPLFNQFFVVFTDYTGEMEKKVEKKRRDKDPILFGTFHNEDYSSVLERFYYIGDWEDEYCDLTLDKMVNEFKSKKKRKPAVSISQDTSIDDMKEYIETLKMEHFPEPVKKKGFFARLFKRGDI